MFGKDLQRNLNPQDQDSLIAQVSDKQQQNHQTDFYALFLIGKP